MLQQLRRDVRAGLQALDDQLYAPAFIRIKQPFLRLKKVTACVRAHYRFVFADRMSSGSAQADAWLGARWNDSMAGAYHVIFAQFFFTDRRMLRPKTLLFNCLTASMQQSVYGAGGARGSPVAAGGRDGATMKKDGGEIGGDCGDVCRDENDCIAVTLCAAVSASVHLGAAAGSDSPLQELRREVRPLGPVELLPAQQLTFVRCSS